MNPGNNEKGISEMKKNIATAIAVMVSVAAAIGPGYALGGWLKDDNAAQTVERSKEGGWVVRNIWGANPVGTAGNSSVDAYAYWCMGKKWVESGASEEEKKRIHQQISSKYDLLAVMKVRTFIVRYAYPVAAKGGVKVGDEVTFSSIPVNKALNGVNCINPNNKGTEFLAVDKVVKHHDEAIFAANGKFLSSTPGNGEKPKEEAKPKPKGNPALDL